MIGNSGRRLGLWLFFWFSRFSFGRALCLICRITQPSAQVIRGAIDLGTSLSSPLRLELAGNRTSSGHTVSQNRSRPEDHLTLAQRFVDTSWLAAPWEESSHAGKN